MKVHRFKVFRVLAGKTQIQVAREAGVTQAFISLIENFKAIPANSKTKKKLAAIVGDDPDELFRET